MNDRMVNELHAVIEQLGGEPILGHPLKTETDLQSAIREGFPQTVVKEVMQAAGITLKELATSLDLSARSLQRRRREGRLARHESDRLYRLARVIALTKHYLGNEETATRWLKRPNRALGGRAPFELIDTELGARAVENVLGRILPTAASVDERLPNPPQALFQKTAGRRRRLSLWRRWSSAGVRLAYTSEHLSLAIIEYFVHVDPDDPPKDLVVVAAEVSNRVSRIAISAKQLPAKWHRTPVLPALTAIGDRFVRDRRAAILIVPSALAPVESNWLINPQHSDFSKIRVHPGEVFRYDPRFFR